jgi:hypothetical protein
MRKLRFLPALLALAVVASLSTPVVAGIVTGAQPLQMAVFSDAGGVQYLNIDGVDQGGGWFHYEGELDGPHAGETPAFEFDFTLEANADPVVSGVVGVTNNLNVFQNFMFVFMQPATPQLLGSNLAWGSIGITVSDGNSSGGATVRHFNNNASIPVYESQIDGVTYQTLLPPYPGSPAFPLTAPTNGSRTITTSFGPSFSAPPVLTDIAVVLRFSLSPRDIAGVTLNFTVIPEPSSWLLASLGALGLAVVSKRRLRRT